jgi:hypothetical protein
MPMQTLFLRLLAEDDKEAGLSRAIADLAAGRENKLAYSVDPDSFRQVPGAPFAYWVSERIRRIFRDLPRFESNGRELRVGGQTSDDFCFLRLSWEVPACSNRCWKPYQKGGDYSRYYSDIHLVADWDEERQTYRGFFGRIGRTNEHPSSYQYFFRPGLTWSRRSQLGLSLRVLPSGCVFADKGPCAFTNGHPLPSLLGLTNSRLFHALVQLQMAFGSYEVGVLQRTPVPGLDNILGHRLGDRAMACFELKRDLDQASETSHVFHLPALLLARGATLADSISTWESRVAETERRLIEYQCEIDDIAARLYGIDGGDIRAIESTLNSRLAALPDDDQSEDPDAEESSQASAETGGTLVEELVSYAVGCVVGRSDTRFATGQKAHPALPDPFDPFPVCSPGMLQGTDGLPLTQTPEGYPLHIDWDGILVDDPSHSDDVVRRVRDVLEVIWKGRADAIEREACEILGVKELRDYFRRPGKGGFWDDHVSRYSKSRRKAPIYWLLQSPKKNYALWLYYHRLDKDILFKALNNHVEPKIRLEDDRLVSLRAQKQAAGESSKGSKKLDKEIEKQEDFVSELRDFADKLGRAARLDFGDPGKLDSAVIYDPDLNDGVVLNIAPLHELVPWKEAKSYWEELLKGEYEWSSMAQRLRAKGLVS